MKVILIGATGTIGQAVCTKLSKRHEVIKVGNSSGDAQVDMNSVDSIKDMLNQLALSTL
jgi:uncharacterized protein YbjT (DUF2867 family)